MIQGRKLIQQTLQTSLELQARSIGSGQIEGACKNLIGRRLKQTGARWKVRRVNRMAGLCSIMYSDLWKTYWNAA